MILRPSACYPLLIALLLLAAAPAAWADDSEPGELHPLAARAAEAVGDPAAPFVMLVEFEVVDGRAGDFVATMAEARRETAKEPGNLAYALTRSLEDENEFVLYEHWKNAAALDSHMRQPYLERLVAAFDSLLAEETEIEFFAPVPLSD